MREIVEFCTIAVNPIAPVMKSCYVGPFDTEGHMPDDSNSERLGLRGTLDLLSNALRTIGAANATGAIAAGASFRFSDVAHGQGGLKIITIIFLIGVLTFIFSYSALLATTFHIDESMGRSLERQPWENILFGVRPPTSEESAKFARVAYVIAYYVGVLSLGCFVAGVVFVIDL